MTHSSSVKSDNSGDNSSSVRVAIYARVSSDQQAQEQTIQSQIVALREQIANEGHVLEDQLCFIDDGVSGATLDAPRARADA